jgi:hypothetical protein
MQLAGVLADEDPTASLDEITGLLDTAYFYLTAFAVERPDGTAFLLSSARSVLHHLELQGISDERLTRLAAAVRDLDGRLPEHPRSTAIRTADEIQACMHEHRDVPRGAALARTLLGSDVAADDTQEGEQLRAKARKFLIEALAVQHDMNEALAELGRFTADAQPPAMFVREIQDMLHNTGYSTALFSIVDLPGAAELLAALLADGRAGLVRASYPGETADRISLLCGVNSFHQQDLPAARQHLEEFLHGQSRLAAQTTAQTGWRKLARLLADAIVVQTTEADGPATSALRLPAGSGLEKGHGTDDLAVESQAAQVESMSAEAAEAVARTALDDKGADATRIVGLLQEEGVLTRERLYLGDGRYGEGVRIVFQAFADFLLLKRRIALSGDPLNDAALKMWLTEECSWGVTEAATILFPEAYDVELPDLLGARSTNGWPTTNCWPASRTTTRHPGATPTVGRMTGCTGSPAIGRSTPACRRSTSEPSARTRALGR